jgi:hypothetical protein
MALRANSGLKGKRMEAAVADLFIIQEITWNE